MARLDDDYVAPPSNDAYTGMLSVSLLALIGGGVMLYLYAANYPESSPPPFVKLAPNDKLPASPAAAKLDKAIEKADFYIQPANIDLKQGAKLKVEVKNGTVVDFGEIDKDAGITPTKADDNLSFEVEAAAEAKIGKLEITVIGKDKEGKEDKKATLTVNVKMGDKADKDQ